MTTLKTTSKSFLEVTEARIMLQCPRVMMEILVLLFVWRMARGRGLVFPAGPYGDAIVRASLFRSPF